MDSQQQRQPVLHSVINAGKELQGAPQIASQFRLLFQFVPNTKAYRVELGESSAFVVPDDQRGQPGESSDTDDDPGVPNAAISFDFDKMPQPSIAGAPFGINSQMMRRKVVAEATTLYPLIFPNLRRPPTQQEADLVAYYTATGIRGGSFGPAFGILAATAKEYVSYRRGQWYLPFPFRVPLFYKRGEQFEPGIIRVLGREVLRGPTAALLQRGFRLSLYSFVGLMLGQVYSEACLHSAFVRALDDPRLKEIKAATRSAAEETRQEFQARREAQRGGPGMQSGDSRASRLPQTESVPDPTGQGQVPMTEKWRRHRAGIDAPEARKGGYDDDSPTGGFAMDDAYAQPEMVSDERFAESSAGAQQDGMARSGGSFGQPGSSQRQQQPQQQQSQSSWQNLGRRNTQQPNTEDDDFFGSTVSSSSDHRSDSQTGAQQRSSPPTGGSVWERIRGVGGGSGSDASADTSQDPAFDSQSPQLSGGSWQDRISQREQSFSSGDREKQLAKSQAQKDFDSMLERERQGKEMGSGRDQW